MKKFLVVLVAAAVATGAWLLLRGHAETAAEELKPVAKVQVAPLVVRMIVETLPAFGLIESSPSGARTVALAYDAVVTRVEVSQGAGVASGDLIMEIEPTPDAKLAIGSARSVARLADQALVSARQRFDLKLATNQDLLAAEQAAEDARLRLASLEGRGQSGDGRLVAPAPGVVTRLDVQPGSFVPAGTVLVAISGSGQLEARLAVEAADAARVRPGQEVAVTPVSRPDAAGSTGTVRQVGAAVDPVSGAVDVRVALPAGSTWYVGERVQGAVNVNERRTLVAPRAAILPEDDQKVLYTVKDGKAAKHVVRTGIAAGDDVEVIAGDLHAGDSAVVVGNYELEDGMAVEVAALGARDGTADEAKSNPGKAP